MTTVESHSESEIPSVEQVAFLKAVQALPENGIALRGDPLSRAKDLQKGLTEPQINYILFRLPEIKPKVWGKEAESLYLQLKSAIDMAMVYADPWYQIGANSRIPDLDFSNYTEYFKQHQEKLPAITYFTEGQQGQFNNVLKFGRTWFDYQIQHYTGDIKSFGEIPAEAMYPTLILTFDDIQEAQLKVLEGKKPLSELRRDWKNILRLSFLRKEDNSDTEFLRRNRKKFREELTKIAIAKLIKNINGSF